MDPKMMKYPKVPTPKPRESRESAIPQAPEEKVQRSCSRCQYKYLFNKTKQTPKVCPYCGSEPNM